MWDRIKQLWSRGSQSLQSSAMSENQQRVQLENAHQAVLQGRYEEAEQQAQPLTKSLYADIADEASRQLALSYFHRQRFAQAWPIFTELAQRSQSVSDWFNVVTSATLAGETKHGRAAFDQAIKAHDAATDTPALSAASMHHYYACALRDKGEYAAAFEHAEVLRSIYVKLPQTDSRLVELRGLPRIDAVLEMMADVLAHSGDLPEAEAWLTSFGDALRIDSRAEVQRAIERMRQAAPKEESDTPTPATPDFDEANKADQASEGPPQQPEEPLMDVQADLAKPQPREHPRQEPRLD